VKPGSESIIHKTTIGTVSVYGFFATSGYLIAGSASRNTPFQHLWQCFLRIFPAFWVCLIVTAFLFGPIAWFHDASSSSTACGFSCYLREPGGPIGYLTHNFWLQSNQPGIDGTLLNSPLPNLWDGSLWTLGFEFLCYLVVGTLAIVGLFKRRWAIAAAAFLLWNHRCPESQ